GGGGKVEHAVTRLLPLEWALLHLPPDKAHLTNDEDFRHRLRAYLKTDRKAERDEIANRYGVDAAALKLPKEVHVEVRGEVSNMRTSFQEMAWTLLLAAALVYLVMAAQFSSWLDPLVMIVAAPLGLIGVALTLWLTGTSLNVQSCMGVLMMVGISVSNSVLLV